MGRKRKFCSDTSFDEEGKASVSFIPDDLSCNIPSFYDEILSIQSENETKMALRTAPDTGRQIITKAVQASYFQTVGSSALQSPAQATPQISCNWSFCAQQFISLKELWEHICVFHVGHKKPNLPSPFPVSCAWAGCSHQFTTQKRDHITSHVRIHAPFHLRQNNQQVNKQSAKGEPKKPATVSLSTARISPAPNSSSTILNLKQSNTPPNRTHLDSPAPSTTLLPSILNIHITPTPSALQLSLQRTKQALFPERTMTNERNADIHHGSPDELFEPQRPSIDAAQGRAHSYPAVATGLSMQPCEPQFAPMANGFAQSWHLDQEHQNSGPHRVPQVTNFTADPPVLYRGLAMNDRVRYLPLPAQFNANLRLTEGERHELSRIMVMIEPGGLAVQWPEAGWATINRQMLTDNPGWEVIIRTRFAPAAGFYIIGILLEPIVMTRDSQEYPILVVELDALLFDGPPNATAVLTHIQPAFVGNFRNLNINHLHTSRTTAHSPNDDDFAARVANGVN